MAHHEYFTSFVITGNYESGNTGTCWYFAERNYQSAILESQHTKLRQTQVTVCTVIWRERCRRIFSDKQKTVQLIVREILEELSSWFEH